jgi:hypothetical protein
MFSLRLTLALGAFASLALAGSTAVAEPLTGQMLYFEQLPLNGGLAPSAGGAEYPGHAELSTATPGFLNITYSGPSMADDFAVSTSSPIVHVEWWGSYLDPGSNLDGVQAFLISFEVPGTEDSPSYPGVAVASQIVTKGALATGSGTFTETAIPTDPGAAAQLFGYSAELSIPTVLLTDQQYWLRIVALVNPTSDGDMQWGWQNRDYGLTDLYATTIPIPGEHLVTNDLDLTMWHYQDDAMSGEVTIFPVPDTLLAGVVPGAHTAQNYVNGSDGPVGINQYGKDMAFRLYAMPEPSTLALIAMGGAALALAAYRRRR